MGGFGVFFFAYKYKEGETKKNRFFGWSWAGGFWAQIGGAVCREFARDGLHD
jgi:hypothetical protein